MESNCTIEANPDIAGIGVRISIYVQALWVFIPMALSLYRYTFSLRQSNSNNLALFEEVLCGTSSSIVSELGLSRMPVQLTGAALLIAMLIQATLYGLSLYHALLVLNLSWLNQLTVMQINVIELSVGRPSLFLPFRYRAGWKGQAEQAGEHVGISSETFHKLPGYLQILILYQDQLGDASKNLRWRIVERCRALQRQWTAGASATDTNGRLGGNSVDFPSSRRIVGVSSLKLLDIMPMILSSLHLATIGAIGLWVFHTPESFGGSASCNGQTVYWIFGYRASATSAQFRTALLAVFALAVCPVANIILEMAALGFASLVPGVGPAIVGLVILGLQQVGRAIFKWLRKPCPRAQNQHGLGRSQMEPRDATNDQLNLILAVIAVWPPFAISALSIRFIVGTEQTIAVNRPLVSPGEGDWTFGQTLAMMLLGSVIWDGAGKVIEFVRPDRKERREDEEAALMALLLRREERLARRMGQLVSTRWDGSFYHHRPQQALTRLCHGGDLHDGRRRSV